MTNCGLYHEDINYDDRSCPACQLITALQAEVERLRKGMEGWPAAFTIRVQEELAPFVAVARAATTFLAEHCPTPTMHVDCRYPFCQQLHVALASPIVQEALKHDQTRS